MSLSAILIVLFALVVGVGLFLRKNKGRAISPVESFSSLKEISSQGHYALFVEGAPVAPEFNASHEAKLALFTLVPTSTEYNSTAVMVFFGPHLVGALSRNDGEEYWNEYGQEKVKARGIHRVVDGQHDVWLDIGIGSGLLGVSSALLSPQVWQLFPIPAQVQPQHRQYANDFLATYQTRIFDARLVPSEDRVKVLVDGIEMGALPEELYSQYIQSYGQEVIPTQALVRRSVSGPLISLFANNRLRDLLP